MADDKYLLGRNGNFYYYRRVPVEVSHIDKRLHVKKSLKTDSLKLALQRVVSVNHEVEEYWKNLLQFGSDNSTEKYKATVSISENMGFRYKTATEIAEGELGEILARIKKLESVGVGNTEVEAALLGAVEKPELTITDMLQEFWGLSAEEKIGKSGDQIRKWENPKKRAINNLIAVLGQNKAISKLDRSDVLDFRQYWSDRVATDGMNPDTGNKDIGNLSNIFRTVTEAHRLPMENPFTALRLKGKGTGKRPPFTKHYVQDILLAPGTLDRLNEDARLAFYVAVDTGCGESEICGLLENEIVLTPPAEHDRNRMFVPHIIIQQNDIRLLKVRHRKRKIPLVGVALWAMKQRPKGFLSYRGRPDSLSGAINKFLKENGLKPTPEHTLYSLRHTFDDSLTEIETPERVQAELMGP